VCGAREQIRWIASEASNPQARYGEGGSALRAERGNLGQQALLDAIVQEVRTAG
jgi:hypothetical protein